MDNDDKVCVDLFSGEGGWSEAFLDRGWTVIRIDNNPKFKDIVNTIIGNIRYLPLKRNLRPDILLMSPPCNCFSVMTMDHYWENCLPKNYKTVNALRTVTYALDCIDYLNPKYWVMENPRAMLRTILGKPKVTTYFASWGSLYYKPTDLWGKFPPGLIWPKPENWEKAPRDSINKGVRGLNNSETRAKIPYKLSEAFCIASENNGG